MGSYKDKPVYIPPYDPPPGTHMTIKNREGRLTYEKQENGDWEVVNFEARKVEQ